MRTSLVRFLSLSCFFLALQVLNVSCSSSGSNETQSEEVAASEEASDEAANSDAAEGNAAAENSNGAESDALANNAEGGNQANEAEGGDQANIAGENNALANNGLNSQANAVANNNSAGQSGGEEDLQQIIEEMNTANTTQLPSNQASSGNAANGVGGSNSVASNAGTGGAPATASGPAMGGSPAGPGLPELGSKMSYIVEKGDTLAKIAQRVYGDANKWTEMANFTGLANPRLIYPGDVVYYQLTEQSMNFASTYESAKRSEIQIKQGDTLATIAGRVFGNSSLWKLIWRQNDLIDNPDRLTAGQTIYYVDPQHTAALEQVKGQGIVKNSNRSLVPSVKVKSLKAPVYEVANDHLGDLFTKNVPKDFLKRS